MFKNFKLSKAWSIIKAILSAFCLNQSGVSAKNELLLFRHLNFIFNKSSIQLRWNEQQIWFPALSILNAALKLDDYYWKELKQEPFFFEAGTEICPDLELIIDLLLYSMWAAAAAAFLGFCFLKWTNINLKNMYYWIYAWPYLWWCLGYLMYLFQWTVLFTLSPLAFVL